MKPWDVVEIKLKLKRRECLIFFAKCIAMGCVMNWIKKKKKKTWANYVLAFNKGELLVFTPIERTSVKEVNIKNLILLMMNYECICQW